MAIAFDSSFLPTNQNVVTSTNTLVFNNAAGNILFVGVRRRDTGDVVSGVTYNSVSMTLLDKQADGSSSNWAYLFYLNSPATGINNIVVTSSATGSDVQVVAVTYSGAATGVSAINANNKGTVSAATSLTGTITPTVANTWAVMYAENEAGNFTAGTGSTLRNVASSWNFFDSNTTITISSLYSMSASWTGSSVGAWFTVALAIAASGPSNLKSFDGNVKSNIKSIDGNLLANIKSLDGNS